MSTPSLDIISLLDEYGEMWLTGVIMVSLDHMEEHSIRGSFSGQLEELSHGQIHYITSLFTLVPDPWCLSHLAFLRQQPPQLLPGESDIP